MSDENVVSAPASANAAEAPAARRSVPSGAGGARGDRRPAMGASSAGVSAGGPRRRGAGPFKPRRKVCRFCVDKVDHVDFKQVPIIRTFVTERGKILSSRITGNCATHQRQLSRAVKRARYLALLPFTGV